MSDGAVFGRIHVVEVRNPDGFDGLENRILKFSFSFDETTLKRKLSKQLEALNSFSIKAFSHFYLKGYNERAI